MLLGLPCSTSPRLPCSYLCDNKFHTEALNELLEADNK